MRFSRSRTGRPVRFRVRVFTNAEPLTPLSREEIFNSEFLRFLSRADDSAGSDAAHRARRLEREVLGVELLSSREKLMAGLPNFATYFGRDGMMTALMMRPIWTPAMAEHVIGSVLGKLGPEGDVSHEEALGGQAIRENAVVYDSLVRAALGATGAARDSGLARARAVLRQLHVTRENYHMVDDEFQLPVLAARYLADSAVPAERKRAFLLEAAPGRPARLALLLRELALVASWTRAYAADPRPENLVSFPRRDSSHWRSASWRDSDAGYAGGRFAMDINAIWAPEALRAIGTIVGALPGLGLGPADLDTASLRRAVETWRGARRHFEVVLPPAEVERRVRARLAALPADEAAYWNRVRGGPATDTLRFLALALDSAGRPIPVVNTDPATGLFLDPKDYGAPADLAAVEMLVTSLLVQADVAMLRQGRRVDRAGRSRTRAFRQSFLTAFAVRIGERLEQVAQDAVAAEDTSVLLPALRDHQSKVDDAFDAVVPHTMGRSTSVTDGEGWAAGHAAADLAQLDVNDQLRARSAR